MSSWAVPMPLTQPTITPSVLVAEIRPSPIWNRVAGRH